MSNTQNYGKQDNKSMSGESCSTDKKSMGNDAKGNDAKYGQSDSMKNQQGQQAKKTSEGSASDKR